MKKTILTTIVLSGIAVAPMAQSTPPQQKETAVYVKLLPSQISAIQQVFAFSFQWLPKSQAPAMDVETARTTIQQFYPLFIADTTRGKKPLIKK